MSRVQLALDIDDLESSIAFYSALFGTEDELNTTCRFASQDKVWVTAADAESFGASDPTADACACSFGPEAAG